MGHPVGRSSLGEGGVESVEAGRVLIGAGEGGYAGVGVEATEEGEGDGSAGAAGVFERSVLFVGGVRGVVAADAVGDDDRRLAGEVGGGELRSLGGSDD